MTAQVAERLEYLGETLSMCSQPLDSFFLGAGESPRFAFNNTACWRGYVGRWKIEADRLYLVGISGTLEDGSAVSLEQIFPGYPECVWAHWFSGTLRCPRGRMLKYVHAGYASEHEADLFIEVRRGQVVSTDLMHHVAQEDAIGLDAGQQVNAFTVFSSSPRGASNPKEEG